MNRSAGIEARYSGKCDLCGGRYEAGDLIDKIPGSDGRRGHLQCVVDQRAGGVRRAPASDDSPRHVSEPVRDSRRSATLEELAQSLDGISAAAETAADAVRRLA